jgi:hypothetical protein
MITSAQNAKWAGLTLKAWAWFDPAAGGIVKAMNVTSITKGATGVNTFVFPAGTFASTNYIPDALSKSGNNDEAVVATSSRTTTGCVLTETSGYANVGSGVARDGSEFMYVAFYE